MNDDMMPGCLAAGCLGPVGFVVALVAVLLKIAAVVWIIVEVLQWQGVL